MQRTKIIAEVASNHGGDLELAKAFVHAAAKAGVDYVKFQSWQVKTLRDGERDPQYEWFCRSELSDTAHQELMEECRRAGIKFLTTCFDVSRIDDLVRLGIDEIKIASPDAASYRLLRGVKGRFRHIIISTGLAFEAELKETIRIMQGARFTLLHCVSLYPTLPERVHLGRMLWLRRLVDSVGYSDHCVGVEAAKRAIALGADYVEKHFCLGRHGPGRVMAWDADPSEMRALVEYAGEVAQMLGSEDGDLSQGEAEMRERFIGRWGDNR